MGGEIWDEPVRGETFPPHLLGLSGIGQLRLFLDGKAAPPPVSHLTGTYPTEVGVGSATFVMPITGWLRRGELATVKYATSPVREAG